MPTLPSPCCAHHSVVCAWCRDMNAATSQEVFAGPYLGRDAATRQKFSDSFADMTNGFLAFPLCVPGTAVWKGRQGRLFILSVLAKGAAESKAQMKVSLLGVLPSPCLPMQFLLGLLQSRSSLGLRCITKSPTLPQQLLTCHVESGLSLVNQNTSQQSC